MKDALRALFIAIGSGVAVKVNGLLAPKFGTTSSILISAAVSLIVAKLLNFIFLEIPTHIRISRMLLDPLARFEGYWAIVNAFPDQPYSYGKFVYDRRFKTYRYEGVGFDAKGRILLDWRTTTLLFDAKQNEISYLYKARTHGENSNNFAGYGMLTFWDGGGGTFDFGTDTWVEDRPEGSRRTTSRISRLQPQEIHKILGHSEVHGESDLRRLIPRLIEADLPCKDSQT